MTEQAMNISDVIPSCLDEIITLRRDLVRLYLATDEQVAERSRTIPPVPDSYLTGAVSDWRFVTFHIQPPEGEETVHIHLLGNNEMTGVGTKITSDIVALDLASGLVATHSGSIYKLVGDRGHGEPTMHQLLQVCGALWHWGKGAILGVLHVTH